jgi:hypothetical protein
LSSGFEKRDRRPWIMMAKSPQQEENIERSMASYRAALSETDR